MLISIQAPDSSTTCFAGASIVTDVLGLHGGIKVIIDSAAMQVSTFTNLRWPNMPFLFSKGSKGP